MAASLAVAAIVFAPLGIHWAAHPELLILRSSQIAVVPGRSPWSLSENLWRVLGMFTIRGDMNPRSNLPGRPALDPLIALWFYVGIAVALGRWRRASGLLPLLWAGVMLLTTVLSEFAPHFRRSVGAAPAVALLIGMGMAWMWERVKAQPTPWSRWLVAILLLATGLGSTAITARDYFARWGALPDLYYAYDEGLWELGQYAASLSGKGDVYLTPRPADHTTLAFAWREGGAAETFDGRWIFPFRTAADRDQHYLVIEHEDFRTRLLIKDLFPQVEIVREFLDRSGNVYARHYRVPAGMEAAPVTQVASGARWPGVVLESYSLLPERPKPGGVLYVRLLWRVDDAAQLGDWTTFVHLLDARVPTQAIAAVDKRPGDGSYGTDRWKTGQRIVDEYQVPIPAGLRPGEYLVELGFYDQAGQRQPVIVDGQSADHVLLGPIEVGP